MTETNKEQEMKLEHPLGFTLLLILEMNKYYINKFGHIYTYIKVGSALYNNPTLIYIIKKLKESRMSNTFVLDFSLKSNEIVLTDGVYTVKYKTEANR